MELGTENFGPKRDEVTGGWRKLHNEELHNLYPSPSIMRMHNEELHNLYSSPSIMRMIKSRRMRWVEHVARSGEDCI
jgi:hypothetical protein